MHRARQRVRREAEALTALDHPGIVALLEVVDEGDDVVLVMPYLAGGTLADQVRAHGPHEPRARSTTSPATCSAPWPPPTAPASSTATSSRPTCCSTTPGHAYLTDFGVATMRDATSGLTATELVIGTPEFMAPEQARGERATPASDVFSLGATLRFAATGTPPYGRGDARSLLNRAAEGKIDRLPRRAPRATSATGSTPLLDKRPERRPTAAAAAQGRGRRHRALPRPARRTRPADVGPSRRRRGRLGPWAAVARWSCSAARRRRRPPRSPSPAPDRVGRVATAATRRPPRARRPPPARRSPTRPAADRPRRSPTACAARRPRRLRRQRPQRLRGGTRRRRRRHAHQVAHRQPGARPTTSTAIRSTSPTRSSCSATARPRSP